VEGAKVGFNEDMAALVGEPRRVVSIHRHGCVVMLRRPKDSKLGFYVPVAALKSWAPLKSIVDKLAPSMPTPAGGNVAGTSCVGGGGSSSSSSSGALIATTKD